MSIWNASNWILKEPEVPKILTIGAFERDNFGDYLFYLLYTRMLAGYKLEASGILFSDRRKAIGSLVMPYALALRQRKWDAVVVVGGEVGAVSQEMALRMCLGPEDEQMFRALRSQDVACRYLTHLEPWEPAYLPDMRNYPLNKTTPLFLNSVGVARLSDLSVDSAFVSESLQRLRLANAISVRETFSVDYLAGHGITSSLRPDVVHAIRRYFSTEIDRRRTGITGRYVVVQISGQLIDRVGIETISNELKLVADDMRADITLFAAGTANYHDDFIRYGAIREHMLAAGMRRTCNIVFERDPLYLVAIIANSLLWIGSSLHGRIIAIEYGVPRISLENDKVSQYVQLWDSEFPCNVSFHDLRYHVQETVARDCGPVHPNGSEMGRTVDQQFINIITSGLER